MKPRGAGSIAMRFSETTQFIFLALGAFFLSLGGAVLLFSIIERLFFHLHGISTMIGLSFLTVLLGAVLLLLRGRKMI